MSRSNKRGVATGAGVDPRTGKSAGANGEDAIEADGSYQTLLLSSSSTTESASVEDEIKGNGPSNASQLPQLTGESAGANGEAAIEADGSYQSLSLNSYSTTESASGEDEIKGNGPSNVSQLPQPRPLIVRNKPKLTGIKIPPAIISEVGLFLQPKERVELIKVHPSIEAVRSSTAMSALESLFPKQYARLNANQMPSAETAEAVVKLWGQFRNLDRALRFAAKKGRADVVRVLVELGANVSANDVGGRAVLHLAAKHGHADVVRVLVELGANISARDRDIDEKTALHYAAQTGHADVVRALVKAGVDVSEKSDSGRAALHYAAWDGHANVVRVLVELGADVTMQDGCCGRTALHYAALDSHADVVRVLVELGADISRRDKFGKTALQHAAVNVHPDVIRALVELGAAVTTRDSCGRRALEASVNELASLFPKRYAQLNDNQKPSAATAEAVLKLWKRFGSLNLALRFAAKEERAAEVLRVLLDLGADDTTRDSRGRRGVLAPSFNVLVSFFPKKWARLNDNQKLSAATAEAVLELFNRFRDLDRALDYAAKNGHADVVRVLVELGARVWVKGFKDKTALHYAAENGHADVVRVLVKLGARVCVNAVNCITALHYAAENGHADVVRVLVELGADISACDIYKETALHYAALNGHADVVRVLVELGADVSVRDINERTALHYAADYDQADMVPVLVELGADVSARDDIGERTPLHHAAERGYVDVVRVLVELGADVMARGQFGPTVLDSACMIRDNNADVVCTLVRAGAQIDRRNLKKVLSFAIKQHDRAVVSQVLNLIASAGAINEMGPPALEAARKAGDRAIVLQIQTALAVAESEQSTLGCRMM